MPPPVHLRHDPSARKSVSLYYYTNGRPAEERSVHDTIFRKRSEGEW